jgi:hypothetical protein
MDTKEELTIFLLRNLEFGWTTIKPVARGVPMSAMHQLQIWMQPLGIRKISNTNVLISQLKNVRHPTTSIFRLC